MFDDLRTYIPIFLIFFCLLPSAIVGLIAYLAFRRFTRYVSPDVVKMQQQLTKLEAAKPTVSRDVLIQKIINQQARKAGIVGALTSIGGFITLPIALPVDVFLSLKIQDAMVDFIASSYGKTQVGPIEAKLRNYLVMTGGIQATETTANLMTRGLTRLIGKSFAKLVPFLGVIIGFAVNYAMAQATGKIAVEWYSGRLSAQANQLTRNLPKQLKP